MDSQLIELFSSINDRLYKLERAAGIAPVTLPTPTPNHYEFDAQGLLVAARQTAGGRIDPVVGPDCPNTVVMERTGHVLSVARPDLGEMFVGYCRRVSDQATMGTDSNAVNTLGSLFMGSSWLFDRFGGYQPDGSNWPQAADRYFNMRAYMTPEELARDDASRAQWGQHYENMRSRLS